MDDLTQQLNQILSDPQQMRQIQSMLGALGMGSGPAPESAPAPAEPPPAPTPAPAPLPDANTLQLVSRFAPLLTQLNQEDDTTRLLRALRPMLSAARQRKLDEALRLLQIMRLLPYLRSSGLFPGLI